MIFEFILKINASQWSVQEALGDTVILMMSKILRVSKQ